MALSRANCTLKENALRSLIVLLLLLLLLLFFFVIYIAGLHLVPNVLDLIAEKISEVGEYSL